MNTLRAWQKRRNVQGQFLPVYHLLQCRACGYCQRSCMESRKRPIVPAVRA
jgi:hypothetical protein